MSFSGSSLPAWGLTLHRIRWIGAGLLGWVALSTLGATDQGYWNAGFSLPGVRGEVRAMARNGPHLYLGGRFTAVGNLPATNLARFDGTRWSSLPGPINGDVGAVALRGERVVVGGSFTQVADVPAKRVAQWDGSKWTALGDGIEGLQVNALVFDANGLLYAGGEFVAAGGLSAVNIARWDGTHWSPLAEGLSNDPYDAWVLALAVQGTDLYAGGFFTQAGSINASGIARWNGSTWSSLGNGVDDRDYLPQVTALVVNGPNLFAGGSFAIAGNSTVNHVARWNGSDWTGLGQGVGRFFGDIPVKALAVQAGQLIVGGRFVSAGGQSVSNVAIWTGSIWTGPGQANGEVKALAAEDDGFWVGGTFVADDCYNNLARWNGLAWSTPGADQGAGVTGDALTSIVAGEGEVLAAGTFTGAGRTKSASVIRWEGLDWSPLEEGIQGTVHALCRAGTNRIAGGRFSLAGGHPASNVAGWNGKDWFPLAEGINGTVYALAWNGSDLFAGGLFDSAGDQPAANVARWDGSRWHSLGQGINGTVRTLAIRGETLYAGGTFRTAGAVPVLNLACWNGFTWSDLGGGVSGSANPIVRIRPPPVSALLWMDEQLVVGGDFALAGTVAATNIAAWDGQAWHALGSGIAPIPALYQTPTITSLTVWRGQLVAGGHFERAGEMRLQNVARWNGSVWSPLDPVQDITGAVAALAAHQDALMVGGRFSIAGSNPAAHACIWHPAPLLQIRLFPNSVRLSWPAVTSDGIIEASDPNIPGPWQPLSNRIAWTNGTATLTDTSLLPRRLYRWRSP